MSKTRVTKAGFSIKREHLGKPQLDDGSQVAVIGSGPAGSFFSYFLLDLASRVGLDIAVDLYEPRDFSLPAPGGCNMCGGIVSESLVQALATDGIILSRRVVQRGISSYVLHMDVGKVLIDTPLKEKRIAAVTRGSGPRDIKVMRWDSFDGYLQKMAVQKGANLIDQRVSAVEIKNGRPYLKTRQGISKGYDLLAVAGGVNSPVTKMFNKLPIDYQPPVSSKTFICEYYVGGKVLNQVLGSSMHVFLLDIPRLEFAAIIPKGDYATVCMIGEDIDEELIHAFLESSEVKQMMPPDWQIGSRSCNCFPRISVKNAVHPFADRIVFVGDSGVTRLYKDGIGAAFRTAKAAASTAVFQGISAEDFKEHYLPVCQAIDRDNSIGRLNFLVTAQIKKFQFARRALLNMTTQEQSKEGRARRMSMVMWDLFTGSAPYQEIFMRTLHPMFLFQFTANILRSIWYLFTHPGQKDLAGRK